MAWTRRKSLGAGIAILATTTAVVGDAGGAMMYGLISEITALPGKRDELAAVLIGGTRKMAGCMSYVVAADSAKPDALWVTEVWIDKSSHTASINLPAVSDAMTKVRPLISGFASRTETTPLGGVGFRQS